MKLLLSCAVLVVATIVATECAPIDFLYLPFGQQNRFGPEPPPPQFAQQFPPRPLRPQYQDPYSLDFRNIINRFTDFLRLLGNGFTFDPFASEYDSDVSASFEGNPPPVNECQMTSTVKTFQGRIVTVNDTICGKNGFVTHVRVISNEAADAPEDKKPKIPGMDKDMKCKMPEKGSPEEMDDDMMPPPKKDKKKDDKKKDMDMDKDKDMDMDMDKDKDKDMDKDKDKDKETETFAQTFSNLNGNRFYQPQPIEFQQQYRPQQFNYEFDQQRPATWESIEQNQDHDQDMWPPNWQYNYYTHLPVDLSNDIAVNQMLANRGAPKNPDAEEFEELPLTVSHTPSRPASPAYYEQYKPIK